DISEKIDPARRPMSASASPAGWRPRARPAGAAAAPGRMGSSRSAGVLSTEDIGIFISAAAPILCRAQNAVNVTAAQPKPHRSRAAPRLRFVDFRDIYDKENLSLRVIFYCS